MLILDIFMVLVFVILFNKYAFGTLAFHEIAGLCFLAGMIVHIIRNRKWIAGVGKKFGSMPTKTKVEYILMWVLLADLAVMTVSGILISKVVFAKIITVQFHVQRLHTATAYLALMLMGLHIGLAWNKVLGMCRNIFGAKKKSGTVDAVLRVIAIVIFALGVYSMVTTNYFTKAFAIGSSGYEEHQMMPDGRDFGCPRGQSGQCDQSSQNFTDNQTTQDSDNSQSETTTGSTVTMTSALSCSQIDTTSFVTTRQGSGSSDDDTSLAGNGKRGSKFGGEQGGPGSNSQRPYGKNQITGDGQMPSGGNGHMNGEHGSSTDTAKTAATELSILGAFAVLAYYLEKLLGKKKNKKAPASSAQQTAEAEECPQKAASESEADDKKAVNEASVTAETPADAKAPAALEAPQPEAGTDKQEEK